MLKGLASSGARVCSTSGRAMPAASMLASPAVARISQRIQPFQPALTNQKVLGRRYAVSPVASAAVAVKAGKAPPREEVITGEQLSSLNSIWNSLVYGAGLT